MRLITLCRRASANVSSQAFAPTATYVSFQRNASAYLSSCAWFVVTGLLVLAVAVPTPTWAITINMEYTDEGSTPPHPENPSWDPDGSILKAHFQAAKYIWEKLLIGENVSDVYSFDFHWDDDIDGLGLTTDGVDTFIEINPNYPWFADPTPLKDEEFDFSGQRVIFGELTF